MEGYIKEEFEGKLSFLVAYSTQLNCTSHVQQIYRNW